MKFPFFHQHDSVDCGPTCLRMIAKFYGKHYSIQDLYSRADINKEGVSLLNLSNIAESIGFNSIGIRGDIEQLCSEVNLPCILHWEQNHFVVLYKIKRFKYNSLDKAKVFYIANPTIGLVKVDQEKFLRSWTQGQKLGFALLLEPNEDFIDKQYINNKSLGLKRIIKFIKQYKNCVTQIVASLFLGGILELSLPLLTKLVVDIGVNTHNTSFVNIILLCQLAIFIGQTAIEFMRSWLLMYVSSVANFSIISRFFAKILRLPMVFFDVKTFGDIMQRVNDHYRIDNFITGNSINTAFSLFTIIISSSLISLYNIESCIIFIIGLLAYIAWALLFMEKRRQLELEKFELSTKVQNSVFELIGGISEIKIANAQVKKRLSLEHTQNNLLQLNIKLLKTNQYQQIGNVLFNHGKNALIIFFSAKAVINNSLSLGGMIAIQFILGQVGGSIEQIIQFMQNFQDASISFARINEISILKEEEGSSIEHNQRFNMSNIILNDVSFRYPGSSHIALNSISMVIEKGKITAIVGASGSGKTTLLKLLMKFYTSATGSILVGDIPLNYINNDSWRGICGAVMQDGFIFSDTIGNNITLGHDEVDYDQLIKAISIANIKDLIERMPLGIDTRIGDEGVNISKGQQQRVLIARAVYKNPEFIVFDEATSSLDATNESKIVHNLEHFFNDKTVLIVAHRLSTVKNADNIIVLEDGSVVETGTHLSLIAKKGKYYTLVKDQLELGN